MSRVAHNPGTTGLQCVLLICCVRACTCTCHAMPCNQPACAATSDLRLYRAHAVRRGCTARRGGHGSQKTSSWIVLLLPHVAGSTTPRISRDGGGGQQPGPISRYSRKSCDGSKLASSSLTHSMCQRELLAFHLSDQHIMLPLASTHLARASHSEPGQGKWELFWPGRGRPRYGRFLGGERIEVVFRPSNSPRG